MKRLMWGMALLVSPCVLAAEAGYPSDLPPLEMVRRVLLELPGVRAAEAMVRAEEANRSLLEAGPYEWTVKLGTARRVVQGSVAGNEQYREPESSLERTFRLPGKKSLDRELGEQGVKVATVASGDARHEAARSLLQNWFAWRQADAAVNQWIAQQALLVRLTEVVKRREQLGDAARIERVQAEAAAAQATAALAQARAQWQVAERRLIRQFPGIVLPRQIIDEPVTLPVGDAEAWVEALLAHSHELRLADEEARRLQMVAGRTERNLWPDPTLGVRSSRERAGEEQVSGIFLSIPLPGDARRAGSAMAREHATAAELRALAVRQRTQAEAESLWRQVESAVSNWQASQDAAERLETSAGMMARAYVLGEGRLADVLQARRQAHEARLAATQAKLAAQETLYRLKLDTHTLWDFDDESESTPDNNAHSAG